MGIVSPNTPSFVVWYYAAMRLGAVAVSVSTRLTPKEVAFMLSDCEARAVVATEENGAALRDEMPATVEHILSASESGERCDGVALTETARLEYENVDVEPDEPAVILYTSGTTGFPKGATLSHQNVRATVHAFNHLCEMRGDDRLLLSVPLFHCYGQNALLNAGLNVGATLILQRRFDLNESKRLISEEQVTKLFGVPTTFQLLCECCEPEDLATVSYCFSAAATLPIQVGERWRNKYGMPIYEGYGLTETAPFASYNHRLHFVPGSIGTPVDLVEMKVVDPETGQRSEPGTLGEIAIRGPNVMLGYWNRPEETAAAIRDGWFHSGDIGRVDANGYYYIVDRVKDMISIGGMKVFPAEVERVLLDHAEVSEAAVVGFPDAVFGERVIAFIISESEEPDEAGIRQHCQNDLADYKVPRQIVKLDELPRNPTGKILKTKLRELDLNEFAASEVLVDRSPSGDVSTVVKPVGTPPMVLRLRDTYPAERVKSIASFLRQEIGTMLRSGEAADVDAADADAPDFDAPLVELGLDSLMIVELRDRLQHEVGDGLELSATLVFDYPRINDLAEFLVQSLDVDGSTGAQRREQDAGGRSDSTTASDEQTLLSPLSSVEPAKEPPATDRPTQKDRHLAEEIESMSEQQALEELMREIDQ